MQPSLPIDSHILALCNARSAAVFFWALISVSHGICFSRETASVRLNFDATSRKPRTEEQCHSSRI